MNGGCLLIGGRRSVTTEQKQYIWLIVLSERDTTQRARYLLPILGRVTLLGARHQQRLLAISTNTQ